MAESRRASRSEFPREVPVHHVPSLAASKIHPSSSSFLHHLHTDPAASHITLAQPPAAPHSSSPSRRKPVLPEVKDASIPLEPTILAPGLIQKPLQTLPHSPKSPSRPGLPPSAVSMNSIPRYRSLGPLPALPIQNSCSPISPKSGISPLPENISPTDRPKLRRATSGRPNTAPHAALSSSQGPVSPEIEDLQSLASNAMQGATPPLLSSANSPKERATPSAASDDSCLAPFLLDNKEISASAWAAGAFSPEDRAGGSKSPIMVLGRSGSLVPTSSMVKPPLPTIDSFATADSPTWNSFMRSYAHGRFDPNKIPNPPRPSGDVSPHDIPSAQSSPGKRPMSLTHGGLQQSPQPRQAVDVLALAQRSHANSSADRSPATGLGMAPYLVAAHVGSGSGSTNQPTLGRTQASVNSNSSSSRGMSVSSGGASSLSSSSTNASSAPSTSASVKSPPALVSRKTTIAARRANSSSSLESPDLSPTQSRTPQLSERVASPRSLSAIRSIPAMNMKDRIRGQEVQQPTYHAEAATVRMAASSAHLSSADLAPLGMPSPERELMDPMAAILTPSHGGGSSSKKGSASSDPGTSTPGRIFGRSSLRAVNEWSQAEIEASVPFLPPILASPLGTPLEGPQASSPDLKGKGRADSPTRPSLLHPSSSRRSSSPSTKTRGGIVGLSKIPPASAPLDGGAARQSSEAVGDYFGEAALSPPPASSSGAANRSGLEKPSLKDMSFASYHSSRSSSSKTVTAISSPAVRPDTAAGSDAFIAEEAVSDGVESSDDAEAEPDYSRRESVVSAANSDPGIRNPRQLPKHEAEEIYERLGFLPAPLPPNESLRRKALYRFNILNTAPDVNFDRIAHLAKLVFSTKIVLIALTDTDTQWHKSESGLGATSASRLNSICSHTLLSRSDEPLVILDTQQDWRFAGNPNVTGPPYIRFYAGAPLRTTDGFNLGSLCVIDDKPRSEFTPRSRLALKEFAAIAVREMELWRDKQQLRARDRIQNSMETFTRECLEMDVASAEATAEQAAAKMNQVYERAAKLVVKTLDVDGCVIFDLTQFEMIEMTEPDGGVSKVYRADPYNLGVPDHSHQEDDSLAGDNSIFERSGVFGAIPSLPVLGAAESGAGPGTRTCSLSGSEHEKLSKFFNAHRDGRIYEDVVPSWVRQLLPPALKYAMIVPIFNVDKQPFALLCAYTSNQAKQFLEGYELQFLRAIGVVILSAVLKRRMVLADKAKSVLISSVSHELRTPLHGILAAAELLADTPLDSNQTSFLRTVQTCGTSLIETVNHVLDFTKLSGSAKSQSQGGVIQHAKVNLAALIEQTVDGCWIGQRARAFNGESDIGSFYAPPAPSGLIPEAQRGNMTEQLSHVETIVDIGYREKGWQVRCEKGGLRRVLMNLIGNSLKFTTDGYVQITLRELPHPPGSRKVPIEMAVIDTGKGIGREFLKDQLFLPFSQENPLQTGTGLGLAIVNSIIRSESVNGKVDVWSSEGVGTEIRISLDVEVDDDPQSEDDSSGNSATSSATTFGSGYTVALLGFSPLHRGFKLNSEVCATYAHWWGFETRDDSTEGDNCDILLVNEESPVLNDILNKRKFDKPVLILSSAKAFTIGGSADMINKAGGFCQLVFKPIGPIGLRKAFKSCVDFIEGLHRMSAPASVVSPGSNGYASGYFSSDELSPGSNQKSPSDNLEADRPSMSRESSNKTETGSIVSELSSLHLPLSRQLELAKMGADAPGVLIRRRSDEDQTKPLQQRPSMAPRGVTYHTPVVMGHRSRTGSEAEEGEVSTPGSPTSSISTISLAGGGVMLKAATLPSDVLRPPRKPRVLVVEDNVINRRVLGAFLRKKGFEYAEAIDGRAGVHAFSSAPSNHWDIVLMDISMPVMDGYEATREIRKVEIARRAEQHTLQSSSPKVPAPNEVPRIPPPGKPVLIPPTPVIQSRTKIFALTGLATPDDKRKAFGSGVDGYLVKPVSLASLDLIFKKIGFVP